MVYTVKARADVALWEKSKKHNDTEFAFQLTEENGRISRTQSELTF